jgi:hypothetical protein
MLRSICDRPSTKDRIHSVRHAWPGVGQGAKPPDPPADAGPQTPSRATLSSAIDFLANAV